MSVVRYAMPYWKRVLCDRPQWFVSHPRLSYIERCAQASTLAHRSPTLRKELRMMHNEALRLSRITNIEHVLDHIVPLNHPAVCGLNVPWNLRIVPRAVNATKGNRWSPGQNELALWTHELNLDLLQPL